MTIIIVVIIVAAVLSFRPQAAVIQPTWAITVAVFSYFMPNAIAEQICSSPGSAFTFLFEYFATSEIPSAFAEDAYKWAANRECEWVNGLNASGTPAIFIQPE
ncbi:MAG: hypothetical protein QXG10_04830 [Candidatus Hadarchaeales archaeon]